jgi:hypothetical protein
MMPVQFPYPEEGWSTGEMRTRRNAPRIGAAEAAFGTETPQLPEGVTFHQDFSTLPEDWTHIERVDGGLHVRTAAADIRAAAGTVVEGIKQSRAKRKEAEAM